MEPQQVLLSLQQGASQQLNHIVSQWRSFNSHVCKLLESLGSPSRDEEGSPSPCRLPFVGIVFSRRESRWRSKKVAESDSHAQHQNLERLATPTASPPSLLVETPSLEQQLIPEKTDLLWTGPVSKEQLGRATWIFLHTLAAQFPDRPTKQQQRDIKELMVILSRLYPCKECADHFKEVLKVNPVQASSGIELAQWMCRVHNIVNRSLGKPMFPCERVDARWGAMDCDASACDLQGRK